MSTNPNTNQPPQPDQRPPEENPPLEFPPDNETPVETPEKA